LFFVAQAFLVSGERAKSGKNETFTAHRLPVPKDVNYVKMHEFGCLNNFFHEAQKRKKKNKFVRRPTFFAAFSKNS